MIVDPTSRGVRYAARLGKAVWVRLPEALVSTRAFRACGGLIHRHYARHQLREQSHFTRFLRNLPQLEVLSDCLAARAEDPPLRITSLGCSTGAELYSILWLIRSRHPGKDVEGTGVDISAGVVEAARKGRYSRAAPAGVAGSYDPGVSEVEDLSREDLQSLFIMDGEGDFIVRDSIRHGTRWLVGDIREPALQQQVGPQDVVLVNNILGPMPDGEAESCLHGAASLIDSGGYLVVEGVDLDLKVRVLRPLGIEPVTERLEAVYLADYWKRGWPWIRWAHEPIDKARPDWALRYSTIFRMSPDKPKQLGRKALQPPPGEE